MKINLAVLFLIVISLSGFAAAQTDTSDTVSTLSAAQVGAFKNIRVKAAEEAAPLALKLAATIKDIYANMLADAPDEKLRKKLSKQMTETTTKILLIKGQTIREMVNLLTPVQKTLLKTEMTKPDAPGDLGELIERIFALPKM